MACGAQCACWGRGWREEGKVKFIQHVSAKRPLGSGTVPVPLELSFEG